MEHHRTYGFKVTQCENGVVLSRYDLMTDKRKSVVATTPQQIADWVAEWSAEQIGSIVEADAKHRAKE